MLEVLRIHDLALIEDIEIEFAPGMNVLTGETGAGKSFILKALDFLTGEKLSADLVRPGKEKAIVEALFVLDGEECILRREFLAESGRSRLYLNDRLCSQEVVRDMRTRLIVHTSQHAQQKLLQPAFQAKLLDEYLSMPDLLEEKERLIRCLHDCATQLKTLEQTRLSLEDKREVFEYQQQEIEKISPKISEEEELENKRSAVRNQVTIAENAAAAMAFLHGNEDGAGLLRTLSGLERAVGLLHGILEDFTDAPDKLMEMRLNLQEIDARLRKAVAEASQTADIEAIESRLYALAQLKRKLKRPLHAIVSLQQEIKENLNFLDTCKLECTKLLDEEKRLGDALAAVLSELNPARRKAAEEFSLALKNELAGLGFSEHVRVFFDFAANSLCPGREDCIEEQARLVWQPNPGQAPQPLDRIASGGELSRFLLAVVSLKSRNTDDTPTLIFDEVDSGVGGLTLNRVAASLAKLAATRQMLLITHWPQLASRATRHFVVTKEILDGQTYTRCTQLTPEAKTRELARMSGDE
ncbi:MAG: AAA family ATPase [Desulfovibrio sp.]|jgi:DNA repair protein RecN (Recombination protein N)|nr:AAA family ATPase [Desulfovibrio sp.]